MRAPFRSAILFRTGIGACLLAAFCALAPSAQALSLTRGPYLQMGTPTTQVLRWRTTLRPTARSASAPVRTR